MHSDIEALGINCKCQNDCGTEGKRYKCTLGSKDGDQKGMSKTMRYASHGCAADADDSGMYGGGGGADSIYAT